MAKQKEEPRVKLFFPYYANQGRLLDIYAILNGGYSEYAEISTAISNAKSMSGKVNGTTSVGFKLFNLGFNASANATKANSQLKENKERKIQTVTSVLSIVESTLSAKGYLHDIKQSNPGDFVCLPVNLSINSIKSFFSESLEVMDICENAQTDNTEESTDRNKKILESMLEHLDTVLEEKKFFMRRKNLPLLAISLTAIYIRQCVQILLVQN